MPSIEKYQTAVGRHLYRVRYRTPDRRSTDKRGFRTKREAEAFLSDLTHSMNEGAYVAPAAGKATVSDLYSVWSQHRTRVKPSTVAKTDSAWSKHVQPMWAHYSVGDIKPTLIRAWVSRMDKENAGPATIETATGLLRMVLDLAVEERRIAANPADAIKVPRRIHSVRGYLTYQQVEHLAREIAIKPIGLKGGGTRNEERPIHGTVVRFLAYTGLRFGEMAALKVSSIDLQRRRVFVAEAVSEVNGKIVWGSPKTHERRSVPYPEALVGAALRELVEGKPLNSLLFAGEKGAVLSVNTWRRRQFLPAVARCQLTDPTFPAITPHDLRHTAVSLAISSGAHVKAVQKMVGHRSAAMTLDTYADLFPDDLDAVAAAMDVAGATALRAL